MSQRAPAVLGVVDDDEGARTAVREWTREALGVPVVEMVSSAEAVDRLGELSVLLLRLSLGGHHGMSVLRALHERSPHATIVVLLENPTPDAVLEAVQAGAYDVLAAPPRREQLAIVLPRAIERAAFVAGAQPPPSASSDVVPLEALEKEAISRALMATGGNVRKAAKLLGIGRATLYRRLRTL